MEISILIVRGLIKIILKWGSFDNLISKWDKCYFKVGQRQLFQSGSMLISKWGNYFKMGKNVISKWGITLSCSRLLLSC